MSNAMGNSGHNGMGVRHLEEGHLLRYLDGELPRRKARLVREHLEACWQCRAEMDALETTVADCVKYRRHVLTACLPAPPEPWKDLSREFDRIDATVAGGSVRARLIGLFTLRPLQTPLRWAAACSVVVALAAVTFYQLRETPSVQAAVLLKRAVVVSESRPHTLRRVRITTPTRQITRVIGGVVGTAIGAGAATGRAPGEAELSAMFREAKYNFEDPLSAKSYTDWRDRLATKQDSVNTVPSRQSPGEPSTGELTSQGTYEIKTTTDDGSLVTATLKLRMTDFEPLEGRFEFRNRDWVEMTELVDQPTLPASKIAGTTGGMPRQPGMPPAFIANPADAGSAAANAGGMDAAGLNAAGWNQELQVVEALHAVGADLGDPVEISRQGRQLLVSGTGIPPKRQAQLHAVLDPLPNVVVRFADPAFPASNPPVQSEPASTRNAAGPESRQLQARIEERLGGRPQFERFSGQLLDWTDSAMARAYALRRLAQEFPVEAERQMSPADRRILHNLGREHLAAFARETARIGTTLTPLLTGLGAAPVKSPAKADAKAEALPTDARPTDARPTDARPTDAWQTTADELLTAARRVESLLAAVLGAESADKDKGTNEAGDRVPAQLMSGLVQLSGSIEQCQRHLSYDER